jgi:hypothetical protein
MENSALERKVIQAFTEIGFQVIDLVKKLLKGEERGEGIINLKIHFITESDKLKLLLEQGRNTVTIFEQKFKKERTLEDIYQERFNETL